MPDSHKMECSILCRQSSFLLQVCLPFCPTFVISLSYRRIGSTKRGGLYKIAETAEKLAMLPIFDLVGFALH